MCEEVKEHKQQSNRLAMQPIMHAMLVTLMRTEQSHLHSLSSLAKNDEERACVYSTELFLHS